MLFSSHLAVGAALSFAGFTFADHANGGHHHEHHVQMNQHHHKAHDVKIPYNFRPHHVSSTTLAKSTATSTSTFSSIRTSQGFSPTPSSTIVSQSFQLSTPTPASRCSQSSAYGLVIDKINTVPSNTTKPSTLPRRADGNLTVTGEYSTPFSGSLGGDYLMFCNGQNLTISGTGYFQIRWEVAWFNRGGVMVMPTWTGLKGHLFHLASGGGRVMTDQHPETNCTWMGLGCDHGEVITLPTGALQMWQNEFYWLNGTVTFHENEGSADYNLGMTPVMWKDVNEDINGTPNTGASILRYGLTRDTGDNCAPVPQYVSSNVTENRYSVRQQSQVTMHKRQK